MIKILVTIINSKLMSNLSVTAKLENLLLDLTIMPEKRHFTK